MNTKSLLHWLSYSFVLALSAGTSLTSLAETDQAYTYNKAVKVQMGQLSIDNALSFPAKAVITLTRYTGGVKTIPYDIPAGSTIPIVVPSTSSKDDVRVDLSFDHNNKHMVETLHLVFREKPSDSLFHSLFERRKGNWYFPHGVQLISSEVADYRFDNFDNTIYLSAPTPILSSAQ